MTTGQCSLKGLESRQPRGGRQNVRKKEDYFSEMCLSDAAYSYARTSLKFTRLVVTDFALFLTVFQVDLGLQCFM